MHPLYSLVCSSTDLKLATEIHFEIHIHCEWRVPRPRLTFYLLCCAVVRVADPHSTFGGSRLGSENPKTLAKNNKNEFIDLVASHTIII